MSLCITAHAPRSHTHRGSSVLATQPQAFCLHARRDCFVSYVYLTTEIVSVFPLPPLPTRISMHLMCVYYESLKRELKTKTIYGCRCDERLKTNVEESTRLVCTPLCTELEHLKIETRLTRETPVSEMGEYASVM